MKVAMNDPVLVKGMSWVAKAKTLQNDQQLDLIFFVPDDQKNKTHKNKTIQPHKTSI